MKKKKLSNPLMQILIVIVILLVLMAVVGYFTIPQKFNYEENICVEWVCKIKEEEHTVYYLNGDIVKYNKVNCKSSFGGEWLCKSHRPKSKCESNPNDEDCECDEYEEKTYCNRMMIDGKAIDTVSCKISAKGANFSVVCEDKCEGTLEIKKECIKAHIKPKPIKINLDEEKCVEYYNFSYVEGAVEGSTCEGFFKSCKSTELYNQNCGVYEKYCCLKKELKNECEKNNIDWVWDNSTEWTSTYGCNCRNVTIIYEYDKSVTISVDEEHWEEPKVNGKKSKGNVTKVYCDLCYNYKKICRKKTIKDLSCKELKKHLWTSDKPFYFKYKKTSGWNPKCSEEEYVRMDNHCGISYSQEEIYNEYLERCIN